ncbi:MAG: class I SAM-dependent methyltransferase [Candidatus Shapirobacteria bacterium]|nr:class I SAM-dependent methyltransferase [Candidatus Shapirobacteria bacterium]
MTNETIQPPIKDVVIFDLVKEIKDSKNSDMLWGKAVTTAKEHQEIKSNDQSPDIEEIISFGEKILTTPKKDRYLLTLNETTSGKLWYDVLMGDDNQVIFNLIKDHLEEEVKKNNTKFNIVADIGCGTGNTLRSIAPICNKIRGVDISEEVIKKAKEIGIPENARVFVGNAESLSFSDQSMDLVVSNGLQYHLDKNQTINFVDEIYRILKPGGKFYSSWHHLDNGELFPRAWNNPAKNGESALIYLMEKMISGDGNPNNFNHDDFHSLLFMKFLGKEKRYFYPNNGVVAEYIKS